MNDENACYIYGSIFRTESNGSNFKYIQTRLHGAGGQVELGQEGVHNVCGGVVQIGLCT